MHVTRRARRALAVIVVVVGIIAVGTILTPDSAGRSGATASADTGRPTGPYMSPEAMAADQSVRVFLDGIARAEWFAGVERAEAEARDAAARAALTSSMPPTLRSTYSGPHSDAWWYGVAICEQGGRNDPYFGYFSFMDGSQGGRTWEDQVAAGNALLERAGREVGPWAASCVAAGYAASPEG